MPVASGQETRVLVAPSAMLRGEEARVVSLRHPRTREAASFLLDPATGALAELLAFQEDHRAWFLGQQVVADGRLLLATPVSPLLLALPYLVAADRLVPFDQLLEDEDFPLASTLLAEAKGLEAVAESKGAADLNVWKYSEERAVAWLEGRVGRVAGVLEDQAIDLTQGAVSHNYRQAGAAQPQAGGIALEHYQKQCRNSSFTNVPNQGYRIFFSDTWRNQGYRILILTCYPSNCHPASYRVIFLTVPP